MPNGVNLEQFQFSLMIVLYKTHQIVLNHVVALQGVVLIFFFFESVDGSFPEGDQSYWIFLPVLCIFSSIKAFPFFLCNLSSG